MPGGRKRSSKGDLSFSSSSKRRSVTPTSPAEILQMVAPAHMEVDLAQQPVNSKEQNSLFLAGNSPQYIVAFDVADVKQDMILVEKSVLLLEKRFASRAVRTVSSLRKKMSPELVYKALDYLLPTTSTKNAILAPLNKVSRLFPLQVSILC
jgi:hypothetical protein